MVYGYTYYSLLQFSSFFGLFVLTGMDAHVLLEVKESKWAIVLHWNGHEEAIQRAVESIDSSIHVVLDRKEDVPANTVPYILQRYSAEWNEFLDANHCDVNLS